MTSQWPVWVRHGVCVSRCTHSDYVGLMALSWSAADVIGGASDRVLVPGSDHLLSGLDLLDSVLRCRILKPRHRDGVFIKFERVHGRRTSTSLADGGQT